MVDAIATGRLKMSFTKQVVVKQTVFMAQRKSHFDSFLFHCT